MRGELGRRPIVLIAFFEPGLCTAQNIDVTQYVFLPSFVFLSLSISHFCTQSARSEHMVAKSYCGFLDSAPSPI
jgi:hypothetical protein